MFERFDKASKKLFYLLVLLEIVIVIILSFKNHANIAFKDERFYTLNTGWSYMNDQGQTYQISLPIKLDAKPHQKVNISRTIPTDLKFLTNLSILTTHQNIEVYVDGKLIYFRYNEPSDDWFDVPTDSVWDMIQLPPYSEGKNITITYSSAYKDYSGKITEVHAGDKAALLMHSLREAGLSLLLACITLIMGIIIILVYLFFRQLIAINKSSLYLGWFTVLCSIWLIMESNLTQLFISNEHVISALTYLTLMTFPIPIIIYINYLINFHYKNTITIMAYIFIITAFVLILLQVFNIVDFHESSTIVQNEMLFLFGCILIILLLEVFHYNNKEIKVFTIASFILFLFGIIEFLTNRTHGTNNGVFVQTGFMIFIGILSWDSLRKIADIFKLSETAKHYKFLATRDLLTNCRNRVSYARDMDKVSFERNITIFVADMDNMKSINDTYGHHAGDEAIVLCSQCLLKVFGRRVYRIGGDEFVSIQYDLKQENIDSLIKEFQIECAKTNEDNPYQFTLTIGYATYDDTIDTTIYDTVKRADKDMYNRKHKI